MLLYVDGANVIMNVLVYWSRGKTEVWQLPLFKYIQLENMKKTTLFWFGGDMMWDGMNPSMMFYDGWRMKDGPVENDENVWKRRSTENEKDRKGERLTRDNNLLEKRH